MILKSKTSSRFFWIFFSCNYFFGNKIYYVRLLLVPIQIFPKWIDFFFSFFRQPLLSCAASRSLCSVVSLRLCSIKLFNAWIKVSSSTVILRFFVTFCLGRLPTSVLSKFSSSTTSSLIATTFCRNCHRLKYMYSPLRLVAPEPDFTFFWRLTSRA